LTHLCLAAFLVSVERLLLLLLLLLSCDTTCD
jgi:hypothetical protein